MTDNGAEDGPGDDPSAGPNEGLETPPEDRGVVIFDPGDDAGREVGGFQFVSFEDDADADADEAGPIRGVSAADGDAEAGSAPSDQTPPRRESGQADESTAESGPASADATAGDDPAPTLDSLFENDERGGFGDPGDDAGGGDEIDEAFGGTGFDEEEFDDEFGDQGFDDGSMVIVGGDGDANATGSGLIDTKGPASGDSTAAAGDAPPEAGGDGSLDLTGAPDATEPPAPGDPTPDEVDEDPASDPRAGTIDDVFDRDAPGGSDDGPAGTVESAAGTADDASDGAPASASASTSTSANESVTGSAPTGEATASVVGERPSDDPDASESTEADGEAATPAVEGGDLSPALSGVASFVVPGLGQYLNGQSTRAMLSFGVAIVSDALLLVVGVGLAAVLGVFLFVVLLWLLLPVVHLVIAWDAFRQARRINRGEVEV
jgi:hypothetical protein